MEWNAYIDSYCERTAPGFWAEPLNFLSNAAFLLAAYFAWRRFRQGSAEARARRPDIPWLIALIAAVGIGSGLFHSLALYWSMLADVIPIGIFLVAYLGSFLRHVAGLPWKGVAWGYAAFAAVTLAFALGVNREAVNDSQTYFGTMAALAAMAFYLRRRHHPAAGTFAAATGVFALSLICRSLDMAVCPAFPLGLHYFWHTLNAVTIYLVMRALIADAQKTA